MNNNAAAWRARTPGRLQLLICGKDMSSTMLTPCPRARPLRPIQPLVPRHRPRTLSPITRRSKRRRELRPNQALFGTGSAGSERICCSCVRKLFRISGEEVVASAVSLMLVVANPSSAGGRFQSDNCLAAIRAAEAAKAAAAARSGAILNVPLWQHSLKCLVVVAAALWGSAFLSTLLHKQADKIEAGEEASAWNPAGDSSVHPSRQPFLVMVLNAAIHAMQRPAAVFLPIIAWTLSVRSIAMFLHVSAIHGARHELPSLLALIVSHTSFCLRTVQQVVYGFSEVAGIIFGVWTAIRLKERLVRVFVENDQSHNQTASGQVQERALERIVLPLSGLASWMAVLSGALMALHVMGINIQPLLTVGGVSGVVVGLSAQSVVSNMISGVNLFLSRPFVVGERIDISHASGAKFLTGYVERVDPMRTILRTDTCMPVMIPNKVLADMIISNESRISKSHVVSNFKKARQYLASISVRYKDMHAVELIVAEMRAWLEASEGVNKQLPCSVGLSSLDNHACNLTIVMHTTWSASKEFGAFKQKLLLDFGRIIDRHNAKLAMPTQITHVAEPADFYRLLSGQHPALQSDSNLLHVPATAQ